MATRYDDNRDLGFGSVVSQQSRRRLLNRDGTFNVERNGLPFWSSLSLYHSVLRLSWPRFLALLGLSYLTLNTLFASAYALCGPGALKGPTDLPAEGRFLQAFFFSVETLGTIGYGNVYPASIPANLIMTVESFVGLASLALATGIIFARFARPMARILFSRHAIIAPYQGGRAFEFRIMNLLSSQLVEVRAQVVLSWIEPRDGQEIRTFHPLPLERSKVSFFPLAWTVVHPVDNESPLREATPELLAERESEFIVLVTGFDEMFSQTVHTRGSYRHDEIIWGARFADVFNRDEPRQELSIDAGRLHAIEKVPLPI